MPSHGARSGPATSLAQAMRTRRFSGAWLGLAPHGFAPARTRRSVHTATRSVHAVTRSVRGSHRGLVLATTAISSTVNACDDPDGVSPVAWVPSRSDGLLQPQPRGVLLGRVRQRHVVPWRVDLRSTGRDVPRARPVGVWHQQCRQPPTRRGRSMSTHMRCSASSSRMLSRPQRPCARRTCGHHHPINARRVPGAVSARSVCPGAGPYGGGCCDPSRACARPPPSCRRSPPTTARPRHA